MAQKPLSDESCQEAIDAVEEHGTKAGAARALGIPERTFNNRHRRGVERGLRAQYAPPLMELPNLASGELPIEDVIETLAHRHAHKKKALDSHIWAEIKCNEKKPFGIAFMGDPHVDSGGCNWTLLRRDTELVKNTDGLYAGAMGDGTDNWVGRLTALYMHNPNTRTDAIRLYEWYIETLRKKWLFILRGNHDMWTASRKDDPITWFKRGEAPVMDWSYRFQIKMKAGDPLRIHAAHSFKGNSYLNSTHGMQRRNRESEGEADLYVQGHHHEWAMRQEENGMNGRTHWYVKTRGYKDIDTFATVHGFGSQEYGATVTAIIDPNEGNPVRRIHCFADLEEAVSYLNYLRAQ